MRTDKPQTQPRLPTNRFRNGTLILLAAVAISACAAASDDSVDPGVGGGDLDSVSESLTSSHNDPVDPGVRGGAPGAGGPIAGLTAAQQATFPDGQESFEEVETVPEGLGPRFHAESCAHCHSHPGIGGTSPFIKHLF